jgi:hypothetical protein
VKLCFVGEEEERHYYSYYPLDRIPFPCLNNMRNGGKVAVVHILFSVFLSIFCCLAILPFLPLSIQRSNEKRRYGTLVFK